MFMYFHTDIGVDHILFQGWLPTNASGMFVSCLVVCIATIVYEGLKYMREWVHSRQVSSETYGTSVRGHLLDPLHILQTLLHALQHGLSYCLMLIAMTFQVYLLLSILIGAALGYGIFAPLTARLIKVRYTTIPSC